MGYMIALIAAIILMFGVLFLLFLGMVYVVIRYVMPWINYLLDNGDRWEQEFMIRRLTRKKRGRDNAHRHDNSGTAADSDNSDA